MKNLLYTMIAAGVALTSAGYARPEIAPPPPHHIPPRRDVGCLERIKELDSLLLLMQKRLAVMHEVARWQWHQGEGIYFPAQNTRVVERFAEKAEEQGIPFEWAVNFLNAQVEAGREIIAHDFEIWSREGIDPAPASDMATEITPYLAKISLEILLKVAKIYPHVIEKAGGCMRVQPQLSRRAEDHLPPHIWNMATRPLRQGIYPQPLKGE